MALHKFLQHQLWFKFKQWLKQDHYVLITSGTVAISVILLRLTGILQVWELGSFDQLIRLRPSEDTEKRIVIVGITEDDLQIYQQPFPDELIAKLLTKINQYSPSVIGLDIYRNNPIEPGHQQLNQIFQNVPNIIGIKKLEGKQGEGVEPPPILAAKQQIGFNDFLTDEDGVVRRNFILNYKDEDILPSLGLKLALVYLQQQGIELHPAPSNPEYFELEAMIFPRFQGDDGSYIRADWNGYQILGTFREPEQFYTISMHQILTGDFDAKLIENKIVLIGYTAKSAKDLFVFPYSYRFNQEINRISGVELHANFTSQILSSALDKRPLIQSLPELIEYLWIYAWSVVGAILIWHWRSPIRASFAIIITSSILVGNCYLAIMTGWWLPLVTPLLGLVGSSIALTSYLAHQEQELQRSKDFFQSVINNIPDPVFVKNNTYEWVILNQAFCDFIGVPLDQLLGKTDHDIFKAEEANLFRQQDELVLKTAKAQDQEETLTNIHGNTYFTETKRSLHKDRAGNIFLIGVIRDITDRKLMEQELRRTAAELIRSNTDLKQSEQKLRYLAHHDPLTSLANRQLFTESLKELLIWGADNEEFVGLLYLDLDGFKPVNDTLGHDMGDLLLKAVAKRIKNCLRSSDVVARLGGDEFTVILPGIKKPTDGEIVAEKIGSTIAQPFMINGHAIHVTTSIGISVYPIDGDSADLLIKKADTAMYAAKKQGKNQYYSA
jgi:diguanylate cyclase (GGDEF)-like protein/PAS domain S-box-containing protein